MSGPEPEWPIRPERANSERTTTVVTDRRQRGFWPIGLALGGLVVLLLIIWLLARNGNPNQDKLTGNEAAATENAAADPQKRCASTATYDLIKRELFRRAAQVRGSDQAAFDRLAGYAVLRVDNPVLENEDSNTGALNCSGSLSLDLPPGVAVVGGRTTLTADVDYTLQRAADNSGDVLLLRNADAIVTPLATLARVQQQEPAAPENGTEVTADTGEEAGMQVGQVPAPAPAPPPAQPAPAPAPRPVGARPSFDCGNAHTRSEIAVCSNAGLATLDRQMAAQFDRAMSAADPEERTLLTRTRSRFLSYRESCGSNACIADAYRGRIREIHDIMTGDWQPR